LAADFTEFSFSEFHEIRRFLVGSGNHAEEENHAAHPDTMVGIPINIYLIIVSG